MNYDVTVVRNDKFDLDNIQNLIKFYYRPIRDSQRGRSIEKSN